MFFDTFKKLCEVKGVSLSRALLDLDMSKSSISRWKDGGSPTNSSKRKIADYFGVTVQELTLGQKEKPADQKVDELSEDAKLLLTLFDSLSPDNRELALAHAEFLIRRQDKK